MKEVKAYESDGGKLFSTEKQARFQDFADLMYAAGQNLPEYRDQFNKIQTIQDAIGLLADSLAGGVYPRALPDLQKALAYLDEHYVTISGKKWFKAEPEKD